MWTNNNNKRNRGPEQLQRKGVERDEGGGNYALYFPSKCSFYDTFGKKWVNAQTVEILARFRKLMD